MTVDDPGPAARTRALGVRELLRRLAARDEQDADADAGTDRDVAAFAQRYRRHLDDLTVMPPRPAPSPHRGRAAGGPGTAEEPGTSSTGGPSTWPGIGETPW